MTERHLCRQCKTGIAPGQTPTFHPGCPGFRDKLARGLRTGNEPHPREMLRPRRMSPQQFDGKVRAEVAARARRREYFLGTLPARCAS